MIAYKPKVVMRPMTKSQGFTGVITPPVGNGLVGGFILQCNPDSFCDISVKTNGEVYPGADGQHRLIGQKSGAPPLFRFPFWNI